MALTAEQTKLLNNATPGLKKAGLGTALAAAEVAAAAAGVAAQPATTATTGTVKQAAAVADAAGAAPTKAEFDALLASLRTAGVLASA